METVKRVRVLVVATVIIWLSVVVVGQIDGTEFVQGAAAILAIISTMTIWSLWALDAYGISVDGTPREKVKHDAGMEEDPRLSLLLSLLTPDERDALRSRLAGELEADGESLPLADLLAEQEQTDRSAGLS
ncbi:MAG: hypothetical protein GX620_09145 [Chloroflexi bacterium]|nr:hypothetical protein [Chloroflexota bacterium]